jgi:hypothetical protein
MGQTEKCGRAAFIKRLQAEDKMITAEMGIEIYNALDAVLALLAIPEGQRIIINKAKDTDRN